MLRWLGIASLLVCADLGFAEESATKVFGWINAEYGHGKTRYGEDQGDDRLGAQQLAIGVKHQMDNAYAVGVFGADALSVGGEGNKAGLQDAFIVLEKLGGAPVSLSAGAQPFLFSLKPSGYPGDRSILPSIEFMLLPSSDGTQFEIARQRGPSVLLDATFIDKIALHLGVFDTSATNVIEDDDGNNTNDEDPNGSSVSENFFAKLKLFNLFGLTIAGGVESRYVGAAIDEAKQIVSYGLIYDHEYFDVSFEMLNVEKELVSTEEDETIMVAELTAKPMKRLMAYVDYASAEEMELTTLRVGTRYQIYDPVFIQLEYAKDDYDADGVKDAESGEVRLRYEY